MGCLFPVNRAPPTGVAQATLGPQWTRAWVSGRPCGLLRAVPGPGCPPGEVQVSRHFRTCDWQWPGLCPRARARLCAPAPRGGPHCPLGHHLAPPTQAWDRGWHPRSPPQGGGWGDVGRLRQRGRAAGLGPSPLRTPRCPGAGCPCLFATSRACGLSLWRGVTVDPGTRLQTEAAMERRQNRPPQKGGVRVRHPSPRGSRVGTHTFCGSAPWLRGHRPRVAHATWRPTWRDGGVFGTWSPVPIRAPGSL